MSATPSPTPKPDSEPIAEVVELTCARELANSSLSQNEKTGNEQDQLASFAELIRKLELADGRPLHGNGRTECATAHSTHPLGFEAAVNEALQANVTRHCGLLVRLVRDGFHVAAQELSEESLAASADKQPQLRPGRFGRGLTTQQILDRGRARETGAA